MSDFKDYEIRYLPLSLDQVIRHFADGQFKVGKGESLQKVEWYIDTNRGTVVFALGVMKTPPTKGD